MSQDVRQKQMAVLQWSASAMALVCISLVVFAAWYTHQWMCREVAALEEQRQGDIKLIARADAVREGHDRLVKEHAALHTTLADLKDRIPATPNEAEFLGQLAQLAAKSAVRLKNFHAGQATSAGPLQKFEVQLSLVGSFSNICKLLDRLREVPRYLLVSRLALVGPHQPGDPCNADLTISICFAPAQTTP